METDRAEEMIEKINHPAHYQGKVECIEAIATILAQNMLSQEPLYPPITHAVLFNVVKYRWRKDLKNGNEDLAKAEWYRKWLVNYLSLRCHAKELEILMSVFDQLVDQALAMRD